MLTLAFTYHSPKRFLKRARSSSVCVWQIKPFCLLAKHRTAAAAFTNTSFVRDGVELHNKHLNITGMLIKPQQPNRHSWHCCTKWGEPVDGKHSSWNILHVLCWKYVRNCINPSPALSSYPSPMCSKKSHPCWVGGPIITDIWGNPFILSMQQLETLSCWYFRR